MLQQAITSNVGVSYCGMLTNNIWVVLLIFELYMYESS